MPIHFFSENIRFALKNKRNLKSWINYVITANKAEMGELNVVFSNDEHVLEINKEYLNHDYYTDIITFDQSEGSGTISGDIYISIDRVRENSEVSGVDFELELRRVIIHGVLHLLGYSDKTHDEIQLMREREEACLSLYPTVPRGTL